MAKLSAGRLRVFTRVVIQSCGTVAMSIFTCHTIPIGMRGIVNSLRALLEATSRMLTEALTPPDDVER